MQICTKDKIVHLWDVEEDGQAGDWQHVAEQETAMTHPSIAIVVMMSQTDRLKKALQSDENFIGGPCIFQW